jgi:hypothetical protein
MIRRFPVVAARRFLHCQSMWRRPILGLGVFPRRRKLAGTRLVASWLRPRPHPHPHPLLDDHCGTGRRTTTYVRRIEIIRVVVPVSSSPCNAESLMLGRRSSSDQEAAPITKLLTIMVVISPTTEKARFPHPVTDDATIPNKMKESVKRAIGAGTSNKQIPIRRTSKRLVQISTQERDRV